MLVSQKFINHEKELIPTLIVPNHPEFFFGLGPRKALQHTAQQNVEPKKKFTQVTQNTKPLA